MKKAFAKYLYPFLFLLAGGFINLYADSQETSVANDACYLQKLDEEHSSAEFNTLQLGLEKRHCAEIDVEEQEEREEELSSHYFSVQHGSVYITNMYVASLRHLFLESNSNFGLSIPKLSSPIKKHVRFQVFRI